MTASSVAQWTKILQPLEFMRAQAMKAIHHPAAPLFVLVILGAITYFNSLPNSFQFDDYDAIVDNPAIRDLRHVPSFFVDTRTWTMSIARDWRPIVLTSYALNYWLSGPDPVVFRLTNLGLHIGVAVFLFLIFKEMLQRASSRLSMLTPTTISWLAVSAAALFLVHTADSEVVNYIFARSTLLATFFYVAAFYCYLRGSFSGAEKSPAFWDVAGLVLFGLGVGSKGPAITLPLSLVTFEILLLNPHGLNPFKLYRAEPGRLKKYIPLALACIGYLIARQILAPRALNRFLTGDSEISRLTYLFTQFRAWTYYMRLFFWPDPLISDYPGFGWSHTLWDHRVLLSLGIIVIILAVAWRLWRTQPIISFFIFWYFIVLLPEASIIPLTDAVNGYRFYPANVGFSVVVILTVFLTISRLCKTDDGNNRWKLRNVTFASAIVVLLCVLIISTVRRNEIWRDERSLWSYIIEKDPTNPRAYLNLGAHLVENGNYQEGGRMFDKAVSLAPRNSFAALIRGEYYVVIGQNAEALEEFNRALKYDPRMPHAYYNRAELYRKLGELDRALSDYRTALSLRPLYTDALYGMAIVLGSKGEHQLALEACTKITDIDRVDARGYRCPAK